MKPTLEQIQAELKSLRENNWLNSHDWKINIYELAERVAKGEVVVVPKEVVQEAEFLVDRLDTYDPDDEDNVRDYYGHVEPSKSRLEQLLETLNNAAQPPQEASE